MATKDFKVRLELDFEDLTSKASDSGKAIEKAFKDSITKGVKAGAKEMEKSFAIYEKRRKELYDLEVKFTKAQEELRRAEDAKSAKKLSKLREDLHAAEKKAADEERRTATSQKDLRKAAEAIRKEMEAEEEAVKNSAKNAARFAKEMEDAAASMKTISEELDRAEKSSEKIAKNAAQSAKEWDDAVENLEDNLGEVSSFVGDMMTGNLKGAFDSSVKFLRKSIEKIGKNSAGQSRGRGATMFAGGLGAAVTAATIFGTALLDVDSKMKEFNRTAIDTFGAMDVMRMGSGGLSKNLGTLNRAFDNLHANLGVSAADAQGIFAAYADNGITLSSFTRGVNDAGEATARFQQHIRTTSALARSMGVSTATFAQDTAEVVDNLGGSLEGVQDQFALVADMANKAGVGTRRFYSMVVQAQSGQSALNVRLDQTGQLLLKLNKLVGMKKAAELVGQHGSDLSNLSTQERYRLILTSGGGRIKRSLQQEALSQSTNFIQEAGRGSNMAAIERALTEAGAGGSGVMSALRGGNAQGLVGALGGMDANQQARVFGSLASTMPELARSLHQLTTLNRGATGGMGQQANALGAVSAGGSMRIRMQSAGAILGDRRMDQLTGPERMMMENITGVSGAQGDTLAAIEAGSAGQFSILQDYLEKAKRGERVDNDDLIERFGAMIEGEGANRRIVLARRGADGGVIRGGEVTSRMDLVSGQVASGALEGAAARTAQEQVSFDIYRETTTIADILENKIFGELRNIYDGVAPPLLKIVARLFGLDADAMRAGQAAQQEGTRAIDTQRGAISASRATIAQARDRLASPNLSPERRAELERQIATEESNISAANTNIGRTRQAMMMAGEEGARSYEVGGRRFASQAEAQAYAQELSRANNQSVAPAPLRSFIEAVGATPRLRVPEVTESNLNFDERMARFRGRLPSGAPAGASGVPGAVTAPGSGVLASAGGFTSTLAGPLYSSAAATAPGSPAAASSGPASAARPTPAEEAQIAATTAVQTTTQTASQAQVAATEAVQTALQRDTTQTRQLVTGTELGDALARSQLPKAIAEADLALRFQMFAQSAGLSGDQLSEATAQFGRDRSFSSNLAGRLGTNPLLGASAGAFGYSGANAAAAATAAAPAQPNAAGDGSARPPAVVRGVNNTNIQVGAVDVAGQVVAATTPGRPRPTTARGGRRGRPRVSG